MYAALFSPQMIYLTNSGSEANDLAMLMARLYTGNYDIVTLRFKIFLFIITYMCIMHYVVASIFILMSDITQELGCKRFHTKVYNTVLPIL